MKTILKTITLYLFILFSISIYSQVTVNITNMHYVISGNYINDCGTIDLSTNSEIRIVFNVNLTKPHNMAVVNGYIQAYFKKSSNDYKQSVGAQHSVPSNFDTSYGSSFNITLYASDFNLSGGTFFVEYISGSVVYPSTCSYSVIKQETPTFTISPGSVNIAC